MGLFSRKNKKNYSKIVPVNEKMYMNALENENKRNKSTHKRRLGSVLSHMKRKMNQNKHDKLMAELNRAGAHYWSGGRSRRHTRRHRRQ